MRRLTNRIKNIEKQVSGDSGAPVELFVVQDEINGDTDETTEKMLEDLRRQTGKNYKIGLKLIVQHINNENVD
jgi:hypothetical protein